MGASGHNTTSAEQFRQYAADCVRVAQHIKNPVDRASLLQMAKLWLSLADIAEKDQPPKNKKQDCGD